MGFKLPVLETDADCGPMGYDGLVFTFWLNATNPEEDWVLPDERDPPVKEPEPWDKLWYNSFASALLRVTIPPEFSDTGEEEVIEIPDAKAVYELEQMPGFEPSLLIWALNQVSQQRQERLQVAAKN